MNNISAKNTSSQSLTFEKMKLLSDINRRITLNKFEFPTPQLAHLYLRSSLDIIRFQKDNKDILDSYSYASNEGYVSEDLTWDEIVDWYYKYLTY